MGVHTRTTHMRRVRHHLSTIHPQPNRRPQHVTKVATQSKHTKQATQAEVTHARRRQRTNERTNARKNKPVGKADGPHRTTPQTLPSSRTHSAKRPPQGTRRSTGNAGPHRDPVLPTAPTPPPQHTQYTTKKKNKQTHEGKCHSEMKGVPQKGQTGHVTCAQEDVHSWDCKPGGRNNTTRTRPLK